MKGGAHSLNHPASMKGGSHISSLNPSEYPAK